MAEPKTGYRVLSAAVFLLTLAGARNALAAGQAAAYQLQIAEVAILPMMVLMTMAGGGYALLYRRPLKSLLKLAIPLWLTVIWASLTLFSRLDDGIILLITVLFGVMAFVRAVKMVIRGISLQARTNRPAEPGGVRLASAGAVLMLVTVFLLGMAGAFYGRGGIENADLDGSRKEQRLADYAAYQMAVSRMNLPADEKMKLRGKVSLVKGDPPQGVVPGYAAETRFEPDGEHFTVLLKPVSFPPFPYNYFARKPCYRADQDGRISMVQVVSGQTCPEAARVVRTVGEADIRNALDRYWVVLDPAASGKK